MPVEKNALQVKIMKIWENQVVQFNYNDFLPLGIIPLKVFGHPPYPEIFANFDYDEKESIDSRKRILKYAEDNNLLIAGMHLQCSNSSIYRGLYKNK